MYNTPDEIGAENQRNRGAKNGHCPLDGDALVPLDNIPTTLTGKTAENATNADTVDTFHASQTPGTADVAIVTGSDGKISISSAWIPYYESAEQTITSAGSLQLTHSLGTEPLLIQCYLICKTAEYNYSIGDKMQIYTMDDIGSTVLGCSIAPDSIYLNIRFTASGTCYVYIDKTTGGRVALTNANWKLIVRAWA